MTTTADPNPPRLRSLPPDLIVCDCAKCLKLMTGVGVEYPGLPQSAGKVHGRPWCRACHAGREKSLASAGRTLIREAGDAR